jgi:predicted DCC family thiol-disulfide oxidoreductase YuxK
MASVWAAPDIVLYDGVCALCNGVVQFLLPRDPEGRFRFAALQSRCARDLLARHAREPDVLDTMYVVRDPGEAGEALLAGPDAVLHIARTLGGAWRLLGIFGLLPSGVRNRLYDALARRRYRLFGRHDACVLPRPEWRARFIDAG